MKHITKQKLAIIHQLCDKEDKSTEYMLQLMQDSCKVNLDTCINYMNLGIEKHKELFKEINNLNDIYLYLIDSGLL